MSLYHWGLILLGVAGLGSLLTVYAACVVAGRADEKMEQDTGYAIQDTAPVQLASPIPFPEGWDDDDEEFVGVEVFDYGD